MFRFIMDKSIKPLLRNVVKWSDTILLQDF